MATNSNQETANDKAWRRILEDDSSILRKIETQGYFDISSSQINQYRETRLACKIDFKQQTPQPLANESLSVLAIKNGIYRIARTDTFIDLTRAVRAVRPTPPPFCIPEHIKALSPQYISSEAKALDAALVSGMLDFVFNDRVVLVLRGYERSKPFSFALADEVRGSSAISYEVDGVQLEVDGGYEGENGIYLVEAKNKVNDNINLRQLLYPHLHYESKFGAQKPIHTYVLLHDAPNETYHFTRFKVDGDQLTSKHGVLHPIDLISCTLKADDAIERDYWKELITTPVNLDMVDRSRPFPQADDFTKVFALFLTLADEGDLSKEDLFRRYAIKPTRRQYDYYGNVLRWLRVADYDRRKQAFMLTPRGNDIYARASIKESLFELAKIAVSNDVFNEMLRGGRGAVSETSRRRNRLIADCTFHRRLSTVDSWLKYFRQTLSETLA